VYREPRRHLDPAVAALLHRARRARGWSYRLAGKRTGVAFGYLAMLEAGRRVPSVVVAEALIDSYKLTGADAEALRGVSLHGVGRDWHHRPTLNTGAPDDLEPRRP
jgi:transcriptional regulator with XRE-family HTH domain